MARKKSRQKPLERSRAIGAETRAADALTVAWTMSVITTVLCGAMAGLIFLALGGRPGADAPRLFARLLHFSGFVAAVLSLVLLGCVLKFRQQPPPVSITWFAVVAALVVIGTTFFY